MDLFPKAGLYGFICGPTGISNSFLVSPKHSSHNFLISSFLPISPTKLISLNAGREDQSLYNPHPANIGTY